MRLLRFIVIVVIYNMTSQYSIAQNTFPASGAAGIGTTSPDQPLTINAATGVNSLVSFKQNAVTKAYVGLGMDGIFRNQTLSGTELRMQADGASNLITLYTNALERIRINANGNVGIGTTNPLSQLQIGPVTRLATEFGNTYLSRAWYYDGQSKASDAYPSVIGVQNSGILFYADANVGVNVSYTPSIRMMISNNGNVGIGVDNPQFKLDINSLDNDGATRFRLANTTSSGGSAPGSMPTIEVLGARGDGNGTFEGRLALGTRRADGNVISNQTLGAVLFGGQHGTDNSFQASKILYPASIQGIAEGNFSSAAAMPTGIVFMTGVTGNDVATTNLSYGTERMRITSSGNVGIGTNNPGTNKLAVEGTIAARKVKVYTGTFADYVFDDNYLLRTLEELKEFIDKYKHLPEMPTTAEVEKDGLDIGDNQVLLVKKIEELTLYVIELKKENQKQQIEIEKLKQQITSK